MTDRQITGGTAESDLEARIDDALRAVFPWLEPGTLRHQLTFSF